MWQPPRAHAISYGHPLLDGGREVQVRVVSREDACPKHLEKHHCEKRCCEKYAVTGAFARPGESRRRSRRLGSVAGLCAAAMLIAVTAPTALAQEEPKDVFSALARLVEPTPDAAPFVAQVAQPHAFGKLAGRYFVDFRARTAASYGHAFLWYGRLNDHGKISLIEVAGLHPASDSPVPYILGHLIPVPAETGKSYGDLDEQYLTANYRVYLKEADAKRVFAYIKHKQDTSPLWLAGVYNCTAFLADIAAYMGLRTPMTATWMYPEDFINNLRDLNGGRQEISLAATH
jgi:hypothetical protein